MATIDTPEGIEYFRLAQLKGCVSLESKGLKGRRNMTALARREFGLKRQTPHAEVISAIQARMDALLASLRGGA